MIEISDVSHAFSGHQVLHNVSLRLEKSGLIALIGPNGSGKSTLLSLVSRLLSLQDGSVTVDGLQIGVVADDALVRVLAILPQDLSISSRLTVGDLVGFGRYPYHKGRPGPEDRVCVEQAMERFDLTALADRQLETLSGGQRQRAFVAMAYAQDTDYLLLDEPLNNLDITGSRALMAQLQDLSQNKGRTVVIVLHDINFAAAYADRIIVLKDGVIAADGAPDEVVSETMLHNVFDTSARVRSIDGRPVVLV